MENFIGNDAKKMRVAEKKKLMEKVTKFLGKKVKYMIDVEGWKAYEIYEATGVPQNRLTEVQNYKKYKREISELHFKLMIGGGMVTIKELIDKLELTDKEQLYLKTLTIHEKKKLGQQVVEIEKKGGDPEKILQDWLDNN